MSTLVMIIDDSPTVRKILEVSLRREGFDVARTPSRIVCNGKLLYEEVVI